jgi:DNA-directed RNA polymerase subunit RPC12/RpoP
MADDLWCADCKRTWDVRNLDAMRCPDCGGELFPNRRKGLPDRRGRVQRRWDPEARRMPDRRTPPPSR